MNNFMSRFKFVGSGIYWNETDNVSVMLNEDYKRTFCAYLYYRPDYRHVVRNKSGNAVRFRSAEAAAKHVLKLRTEHREKPRTFRFTMVCPVCGNINSDVTSDRREPTPPVSCGDCLMERCEVNNLKVVKVEEVSHD